MARGEGIKKVSDLFSIYQKRLKAPQKTVIREFVEVVSDLGYKIRESEVKYTPSSRTLVLMCSGMLKTELMMRKDEILTHLRARLGDGSAAKELI